MTELKTIDSALLDNVSGGSKKSKELNKAIQKVWKKMGIEVSKKKGVVPGISEGDFGAAPSSFISIGQGST